MFDLIYGQGMDPILYERRGKHKCIQCLLAHGTACLQPFLLLVKKFLAAWQAVWRLIVYAYAYSPACMVNFH